MFEAIKKYFKYELGPAITNIPWKKIPPSTYVGWVMAILLSVNSILMLFGVSPINYNEDSVAKVVTLIVNVLVLIANTYNNNSTSREAVFGDRIVTALKLADESDKKDAIDKLNVILHELNNSGAYATIVIPDDETTDTDDDNDAAPELGDETLNDEEESSNEVDEISEEHTKSDDDISVISLDEINCSNYNGFVENANVTFVNVDDKTVSVTDLLATDNPNDEESKG
jgi:uncharacterized membrane protein